MPRLIITADGFSRELELKPGVTSIGRAVENDCHIPDASVSGRHCEVICSDGVVRLIDSGSTNGTFVDGRPIREAVLQNGQAILFGSISAMYIDDLQTAAPAVPKARLASVPRTASAESSDEGTVFIPRAVPAVQPGVAASAKVCSIGKPPAVPRGNFFALFPGAFAYPLIGSSIAFLIVGTIFYVVMEFLSTFSFYLRVIFGGYTAAFSFHLCQSTANDPTEPPSWPDVTEFFGDILMPFIQVTVLSLACIGPAVFLLVYGGRSDSAGMALLAIPAGILGAIYFPMGLLALSIFESVVSANPLVVFPAIVKVPLEYFLVCLVFGGIVLVQYFSESLLHRLIPMPLVPSLVAGLFSLYFLMVEIRLLGLLFYARKERFGWL